MPKATLFAVTVAVIVISEEPSNSAEPDKSPPKEIVLDVANLVAVSTLPVTLPVTLPIKLPRKLLA